VGCGDGGGDGWEAEAQEEAAATTGLAAPAAEAARVLAAAKAEEDEATQEEVEEGEEDEDEDEDEEEEEEGEEEERREEEENMVEPAEDKVKAGCPLELPTRSGGGPGGSSQFKGVTWSKSSKKWQAASKGRNGRHLGVHATEEEAAQAVDDYAKHGTVPESKNGSSQFKGVTWDKRKQKWKAQCQKKYHGLHATEEDAARSYNVEAARLGLTLNVIPPVGAAGAGPGAGGSASSGHKRAAPQSPAAGAYTHPSISQLSLSRFRR